jgi:hypothetical protein
MIELTKSHDQLSRADLLNVFLPERMRETRDYNGPCDTNHIYGAYNLL